MEKQFRREKVAEYKERKVVGGVYVLKNTENGKQLLLSAADLQGSRNRFTFSQQTNSCIQPKLQKDWETFGKESFQFEVLEELEKKETQTAEEFAADVKILEELWREKLQGNTLY